jgi:hypothetical protein
VCFPSSRHDDARELFGAGCETWRREVGHLAPTLAVFVAADASLNAAAGAHAVAEALFRQAFASVRLSVPSARLPDDSGRPNWHCWSGILFMIAK